MGRKRFRVIEEGFFFLISGLVFKIGIDAYLCTEEELASEKRWYEAACLTHRKCAVSRAV